MEEREGGGPAKRNNAAVRRREENERIQIWRAAAARMKDGGEGCRPERWGGLPGLVPNGGLVINRSYGRGAARQQKPNDALGLISPNRRPRGPAAVGAQVWRKGADRGGGRGRETNHSLGEMSISASVRDGGGAAEGGRGRRRRRRGRGDWSCHTTPKLFRRQRHADSELGDSNLPSSSISSEREETESDTETQWKSGGQHGQGDSERELPSERDGPEDAARKVPQGPKIGGGVKEHRENGAEAKTHGELSNEDQKERSAAQTVDVLDALAPIMEDTEEETSA